MQGLLTQRPGASAPDDSWPEPLVDDWSATTVASEEHLEFPGFTLVGELGRGALGRVLLARQVSDGRLVAIQVLHPQPDVALEFEDWLMQQAEALRRLTHPNLVEVYGVVRGEQALGLVMEHVPGTNLARELGNGPFEWPDVVLVVTRVAAALDCAHRHGFVHGDLKPSDVLVGSDGEVKLAGLGLSGLMGGPAVSFPEFRPPELAQGGALWDHRADVYSLGVLTHELAFGRPAGPDEKPDLRSLPPLLLRPDIPPTLGSVLMRALDPDPRRRPASVQEFVAALGTPVAGSAAPAHVAPFSPDRRRSRKRSWPWLAAALAASCLLAAAVAVAFEVRSSDHPGARTGAQATAAGDLPSPPTAGSAAAEPTPSPSAPPSPSPRPSPSPSRTPSPQSTPVAAAPAFAVVGVQLTVNPASGVGQCPRAEYELVATVQTNAVGGRIRYQWLLPDGTVSTVREVQVAPGAATATLTRTWVFSGRSPAEDDASLHVLAPQDRFSNAVRLVYRCP